jgi:hypothetical protein
MGRTNSLEAEVPESELKGVYMHAKRIARGFDENRESGLVREWSFARLGLIEPDLAHLDWHRKKKFLGFQGHHA